MEIKYAKEYQNAWIITRFSSLNVHQNPSPTQPPFLQVLSTEGATNSETALTRSAFLEYGRLLLTVGNVGGARYYAKRAGSCAEALLKDATAVEIAFVKNAKEKKEARAKWCQLRLRCTNSAIAIWNTFSVNLLFQSRFQFKTLQWHSLSVNVALHRIWYSYSFNIPSI